MKPPYAGLDDLDRPTLVRIAHEYMLFGMIATRAMLPQVIVAGGGFDELNEIAIDEWMGASPIYTRRMRSLMGIEGDDIAAIMKALQLDVGFVHEYMDVAYRVLDDRHGEFWLRHCGALLDAEPHGEERVFGMCHTIEDPTFDATAYATNPRARIRPIHRPPRLPADRHPHCHWTIEIDPANDPVGAARLTGQVGALPLASAPNQIIGPPGEGMGDYRGPFRPKFRLADLASGALAAVAREFQMQTHLLMCAGQLALEERLGPEMGREIAAATGIGAGWVMSERLQAALGVDADPSGVAQVLELHPMLPPGFDRDVRVDGDRVSVALSASIAGLLDAGHPGCPGLLARGDARAFEAMVHALVPTSAVLVESHGDRVTIHADLGAGQDPASPPDAVALAKVGIAASWKFSMA